MVEPGAGAGAQSAGIATQAILPDTLSGLADDVGPSYRQMVARLSALQPKEGAFPHPEGVDGVAFMELTGFVVDETQTRIAGDFYDVFFSNWEAPEGAVNFTIRIQEQPSPTLGTRVVVLIDDEVLFQLQLQPRYEVIEGLGQQAAAFVAQELASRQATDLPAAVGGGEPADSTEDPNDR